MDRGKDMDMGFQTDSLQPALLTRDDVAKTLNCSPRTLSRLVTGGRMPAPVRLGRLVRWNRQALEDWIAAGCPPCRRRR